MLRRLFRETRNSPPEHIAQPIPDVSNEDVERIAVRDFPDKYGEVMRLLADFHSPRTKEYDRVRMAILKIAAGDSSRLPELIAGANRDYRDALAAAEYPNYMRLDFRKSHSQIERKRAIEADWQQYQDWLQRL